jgi:hypothetical protein
MIPSTTLARLALVALASALLLGLIAGAAFAVKKTKVSATLTFTPPSDFSGKVSSKDPECKDGAKVSLRYFQSTADTTADVVGKDKANKKGRYEIEVPNAIAGEYQVMVPARKVDGEDPANCAIYLGARIQF